MTSFFNAPTELKHDVPADAIAILVVIHGMAEYSARYVQAIEWLNARGIGCCSYDQRGHGSALLTERERGDVVVFQDLVVDAATAVDNVRARYPQLPIFVWGHSMGAIVATLAVAHGAALGPPKVRGVITSSAPIAAFDAVPTFVLRMLNWLAFVAPKLRMPLPIKPERLSRDLQVGLRYAQDPLVPKAITLRLLVQLAAASTRCVQVARRLKTPWLALHGTHDEIAPAIGSQRLIDALASSDKYLRVWPLARHEVHNEIEPTRNEFLGCMVAWVKERT
jgi:alpha-beta hydrolase superfamily lysophospholipase